MDGAIVQADDGHDGLAPVRDPQLRRERPGSPRALLRMLAWDMGLL